MTTALTTTNRSRDFLVQSINHIVNDYAMCERAEDYRFLDEDAPRFHRDCLMSAIRYFQTDFKWVKLGWY